MSHIGKKPINIPEGIEINIDNSGLVNVKGKLGELSASFNSDMIFEKNENILNVKVPNDTKRFRELHGLTRALIANMIEGVSNGYSKESGTSHPGSTCTTARARPLTFRDSLILLENRHAH